MNHQWDLSPLYVGFDDPRYAADLEALKVAVEETRVLPEKQNAMESGEYLRYALELEEKVNELVKVDWNNYYTRIKIGLMLQFMQF